MSKYQLQKIALLGQHRDHSSYEVNRIQSLLNKKGIESKFFTESDDIDEFAPDCVIALTPEEPKLTKYPTYGLMDRPAQEYLSLPRYIRNLLTYDGYLTISKYTKQMLEDLMFGARKLNTEVAFFHFTDFLSDEIELNFAESFPYYFETDITYSPYKIVLKQLKKEISYLKIASNKWSLFNDVDILKTNEQLKKAYQKAGVGIVLDAGDDQNEILPYQALQVIASSAILIAPYSTTLREYFDDAIYYFSANNDKQQLVKSIKKLINRIKNYPEEAKANIKKLREYYQKHFDFNQLFENFCTLHERTLINKGFVVNPEENSNHLPSISYIVRTGGKKRHFLEMALTSLVKQQYPKITVILVIHKEFDYLDALIAQYPSLTFKVVYSLKSIRSKAICDGMATVETDLFGMLDDDDELHPNHIRTMVHALKHHQHRDWRGQINLVYSGSIIVNKKGTFETEEEFIDSKLDYTLKKRCIEHFRFYRSLRMANHCWFMMSNAWLASKKLIDDELLTDPGINTCEDLYFELQFAQRTQFAFSTEVTVFHHFHNENSTIVDNKMHIPDTKRIALRNAFRTFRGEFEYDNYQMPLGEHYQPHLPVYANQEMMNEPNIKIIGSALPVCAPQFFSSFKTSHPVIEETFEPKTLNKNKNKLSLLKPIFLISVLLNDVNKRKILINKTKLHYRRFGLLKTIARIVSFDHNASQKTKKKLNHFNSIITSIKELFTLLSNIFSKNKLNNNK